MKVGDLVKVLKVFECELGDNDCACFFCSGKSNRIGLVVAEPKGSVIYLRTPEANLQSWKVRFDIGVRELYDSEVEIMNESR